MAAQVVSPADFQRVQAQTAQAVLLIARREWDTMESLDDWPRIAAKVTAVTGAGQLTAARRGAEFASSMLAAEPVAAVNPRAWAMVAPDGRPLSSLLYSSVVHSRATYTEVADQLASGRKWLSMLAHTAVSDAGRGATQAQIALTPGAGYTRLVNPPCCQRCAVLAGKWFQWNTGFQRHPRCDCTHVPVAGTKAPKGYTGLIGVDDIHDLTDAQRQAIEDGADLNQVINAYRNLDAQARTGAMFTSEGVGRGWASSVAKATGVQRRYTPEAIYRLADSREEAARMLAQHGYIVGDLKDVARLAG